jgi:dTDP-4-dehydrorhamnose 3,5-epimerase
MRREIMIFEKTPLAGAYVIRLEEKADERGFFARSFCQQEFAERGLRTTVAQSNLAYTKKAGTLRGMHYQVAPATETKLVRCIRGAIYDVIIDLRPDSLSYLQHFGIELSADNRLSLYVPDMVAHGYQALTDGAEVLYQVSEFYTPGTERGLPYNDPAFAIDWPLPVSVISDKDRQWTPLRDSGS